LSINCQKIKRLQGVEEDSLREAVLQLIGGNASNSFHSPSVLLTNLVLYISLKDNLQLKLNVIKMQSFGDALAFVEAQTSEMNSVTLHLGRRPTPLMSRLKANITTETEEISVNLVEIVSDDDL
jgi:hypothetical protein